MTQVAAKDFGAHFGKLLKAAGDKAALVAQKSAESLLNSVVEKSPVGNPDLWKAPPPPGYSGGHFRANWNVSFGSLDASVSAEKDTDGAATISKGSKTLTNYSLGDKIFITNSLPYAHRLEYDAWSTQAPVGMVRISAAEFESYVRAQAAKL